MDAKSRALNQLGKVREAVARGDQAQAESELDNLAEIIGDGWSIPKPVISEHRSYRIPGLSGGCTWGGVPLN